MFTKVLIANRGAIAVRIIRTLHALNIQSVAVYAKADASSLHVDLADETYCLGDGNAANTYLDQDLILDIAKRAKVDAIHPGYGFLSENADFAEQCLKQNLTFIGPTAQHIRDFGLKHKARELAQAAQVPLLPGSPLVQTTEEALDWSEKIGYPVMIKSTAGGGGIGMQCCHTPSELKAAIEKVKHLGQQNFSNDGVLLKSISPKLDISRCKSSVMARVMSSV